MTLLTAFMTSLTKEHKSELLGFISTPGEVPGFPSTPLCAFPCQLAACFLQANTNNFHSQHQQALRQHAHVGEKRYTGKKLLNCKKNPLLL